MTAKSIVGGTFALIVGLAAYSDFRSILFILNSERLPFPKKRSTLSILKALFFLMFLAGIGYVIFSV